MVMTPHDATAAKTRKAGGRVARSDGQHGASAQCLVAQVLRWSSDPSKRGNFFIMASGQEGKVNDFLNNHTLLWVTSFHLVFEMRQAPS